MRMTFSAKILKDSMNATRLTTMEVTFPRCILSEFNTHRVFSRNSASSRAIPVSKMIQLVEENPYIPTHWGKNQKGMQAEVEVSAEKQEEARVVWLKSTKEAIATARHLNDLGIHKQVVNRVLEPYMWHTVIVTATEWSNFFHLRCHPDAHPEIQRIATMMRDAYETSAPTLLTPGEWHTPFVTEEEKKANPDLDWLQVSAGRCARVSYLTHDGKRDPQADLTLCNRLIEHGHLSPLEHIARPMTPKDLFTKYASTTLLYQEIPRITKSYSGNLRGWVPFRKTAIEGESDIFHHRSLRST